MTTLAPSNLEGARLVKRLKFKYQAPNSKKEPFALCELGG